MGRAKLNMELIKKEKSRNVTFKKRKEGLVRKMHEFATLCDVSACMIIYGPKQETCFAEPEIWPPNAEEVRRIIDIYKAKSKDSGNKTFGLSDFFHDRKRRIEDELNKLRKKNMEAKYPTWPEFLNYTPEARLREFAAALINKSDYVRLRIEFLRRSKEGLMDMNMMDLRLAQSHMFNQQQPIEMMHAPPIHHYYPTFDHHRQEVWNQNSMMTLLADDQNNVHLTQLGTGQGQGSSSNAQLASSYKRQVFHESTELVEMGHNPMPLARYYGSSFPFPVTVPAAQPMSYITPQIPFSAKPENNGDGMEDLVSHQYEMNHSRGRYYE